LQKRIFYNTLSEEGLKDAWEGNREDIYRSNLVDFQKHPLFGNGFGHQMHFDAEDSNAEGKDESKVDNSFMNLLIKTGSVGLIIFLFIVLNIYFTMKKTLNCIEDKEDWIYLRAMLFVFPFFVLISLNISILYGYPEVIIFSLFFAKASMMYESITKKAEHSEKLAATCT
jgi:O-antigen ligase